MMSPRCSGAGPRQPCRRRGLALPARLCSQQALEVGVEVGVELKQHHIGLPVLLLALQQRRVVSLQRRVLLLQRLVVCLQLLPRGICLMQQRRPCR